MADNPKLAHGDETWLLTYRKRALTCLGAAAFLEGVTANIGFTSMRVITAFTEASAVVAVCMLDAPLHQRLFLRSFTLPLLLTWPVGALVHLVWTRGWRRGFATYFACVLVLVLVGAAGMLVMWTLRKALG